MKSRSIYGYYAFGYNYSLLCRRGPKARRETIVNSLKGLIENFDRLVLPVTKKVASRLIELTDELDGSKDDIIGEIAWRKIKLELDKIDPALDAELQLRKAYVLTEKRFELDKLLNKPGDLLGGGLFDKLASVTARDYRLACRQIALNQSTSAAFHLMRALESEVKVLYFAFKKTKRLEKPMWGPMTQQLRQKKSKPKPSEILLDHLDSMRSHFRNPTQHPDKFYDIEEAQDLLSQTITAIRMIHDEIPQSKTSGSI